jgi:Domain of unknown function (DUF1707)
VAEIRASDAERERTVGLLRDAAAEGRLNFEELADRIGAAQLTRERGELERLTADLPVPEGALTGRVSTAPQREARMFSDVRRSGAWVVPAEGKWTSCFGDIVLDLRDAQVTSAELHLAARSVFGDIDVLVPACARSGCGRSSSPASPAGPPLERGRSSNPCETGNPYDC